MDNVSLRVNPGEFVSLVGPSGSGKPSLLAVAATLIKPSRGLVVIDGTDATALGDKELAGPRRDRMGIVFQPNLLASLDCPGVLESDRTSSRAGSVSA